MEAKKMIGGLLVGAAMGFAAGILLAPSSGERTRKKLIKGSMKVKKNVTDYVEDSMDTLRSQVNEKIDTIAKRSKEVINHAGEKIKI